MRQSLILLGVCGLVLVGAWLGTRALSEPPPSPSTPPPSEQLVVAPQPLDKGSVIPRGAIAAPVGPGKPLNGPHVLDDTRGAALAGEPGKPARELPPDEDVNPFLGESRELDYADKLMFEDQKGDAGIERLLSAREVYQRCIDSVDLQRCKDGLAAVNAKLAPARPTAVAPMPSLGPELGPTKTLPRPIKRATP